MPLPSYEDFKVKRQAYLEAKDAAINKAHHTYAEAVYSMFEKGLPKTVRLFWLSVCICEEALNLSNLGKNTLLKLKSLKL